MSQSTVNTVEREFSLPGDLVPTAPAALLALAATPSRPTVAHLADLARRISRQPQNWWHLVRFEEADRSFTLLTREEQYEVWLQSWLPGHTSGLHDHGDSSGVFAVALGQLTERFTAPTERFAGRPGHSGLRRLTVGVDQVRVFGPHYVHEVANTSAAPAVSIHVYSPVLSRMGKYREHGNAIELERTEVAGVDW